MCSVTDCVPESNIRIVCFAVGRLSRRCVLLEVQSWMWRLLADAGTGCIFS